ncbi:HAD family hydrolase [Zavarzinella formosa]|uniref:HAD family hydrolase n=1 Tax=Zavarzinella formosa TaxID=360055 RepID=UPI00030DD4EA|nr:HAD family hydrolase [Zavarzinella formosa]
MPVRITIVCWALVAASVFAQSPDPLASWNEGPRKKAVLDFVAKVTKEVSPDFVPVAERIAVFDNDGTLWCEQPMYVQLAFALDRVKAMADKHPEWKDKQPFKAVIEGDLKTLAEAGEKSIVEIVLATHTGMTTDEFAATVKNWLVTAKHPKFQRPYTECVYQPMLEVLAFLRANGFKTFIVSGGTVDLMRPFAEKVYGIPPEQVVGTTFKTKYELRDGKPAIVIQPQLDFLDDKAGKPVAINKFIGRRPVMAFGNSDGDFEMLEWTAAGSGPRFGMIVHHTDAEREYAYDRKSHFGRLERGLDEAAKRGWLLADMKNDWKVVFPPTK